MSDARKETVGKFPGGPGPGRPKGVPNKTTTALKAAENVGSDGKGKGGLTGPDGASLFRSGPR